VVENPLGCYDETRHTTREAMVRDILSVFDVPPFPAAQTIRRHTVFGIA